MQILIPMGGAGSRFAVAGYSQPKPFITFHNKTMIEHVLENLGYNNDYHLVLQQDHYRQFSEVFKRIYYSVSQLETTLLSGITRGAAESCLHAKSAINQDLPLMIANCDQIMNWDPLKFDKWFSHSGLDGAMITYDSQSTKNSYAAVDEHGLVTHTAEKTVISPYATNGIHVWRRAGDFFSAAEEMIKLNLRTNNEFYIAPVYNINISRGQRIGIYPLNGSETHWPIGTPEDLTAYLDHIGPA